MIRQDQNVRLTLSLGILLLTMGMLGCDSSSSGTNITIEPSSVFLPTEVGSVAFTASGSTNLLLPLEWSVSNPELGGILRSEGLTAIYGSTGQAGNNAITVRDQGGREGVAVVTASEDPLQFTN